MRNNNTTQEYIDIPLSPDDTPLHLAEKLASYDLPKEPIDIGFDLITRLDEAIRQKDPQELLSLSINYYEVANSGPLADQKWPKTHEIEGKGGITQRVKRRAISAQGCRTSTTS